MPARIVVAPDEPRFAERTVAALATVGYEALAFHDSLAVLPALKVASRVELLITCVEHGEGKP